VKAIETEGLTKYYGRSRGIVDVDLEVNEGEIFGFIGPNGAGKTTTIRLLLNFIFPTRGSARVLGLDAVNDSRKIRDLIGYLPGEAGYYDDMTVDEFLRYCARFYPGEATSERMDRLIDLFEVERGRRIYSLSQGNKKKVGVIQALLHRPRLLILDEPTNGLDPLMQKRFFDLLREERENGVTVFFSSHILDEVQRLCDRVAIIREGRIVEVEDVEQLRNKQFRTVRVAFRDDSVPRLDVPGIVHRDESEGAVRLLFNGDVNHLVRALAQHDLRGLWLEEPTLEEVFMHYYEDDRRGGGQG